MGESPLLGAEDGQVRDGGGDDDRGSGKTPPSQLGQIWVLLLFPWVLTRDFSLRHIGNRQPCATRGSEWSTG